MPSSPSLQPPSVFKAGGDAMPAWKRALDIVCCVIALPVLALATLLMTIVVQLTSPGPVFFQQVRVGYCGRRFTCYKFRTMKVSADSSAHRAHLQRLMRSGQPLAKMDGFKDNRLIPGAWVLRACGLDELPQVINVLRGEMTIVGPRPCLPYEYEDYLPWQQERFCAMPGLTGLWQVSGKHRTTFDQMVRLDIQYARERSLGLDLKIILKTVPALLSQVADTRRCRRAREIAPRELPAPASRAPIA